MPKKTSKKRQKIKKATRRKRKIPPLLDVGIVVELDQIYKVINRVQLTREASEVVIRESDSFVIENIFKDAGIIFKRITVNVNTIPNCLQYTINPPKIKERIIDFEDFDEFPDEIIEDGQVF